MSLTGLNAYQQGGPVLDKLKSLWEGIRGRADDPSLGYIGASMLPGIGEATDLVEIVAGLQDRSPGRVGLGIAGLMLPFVGAASLKKVGPKLRKMSKAKVAENRYYNFVEEVEAIEDSMPKLDLYLQDGAVDHVDALSQGFEDGTEEYYKYVYGQALERAAAGTEAAGLDLNELLGRIVY